MDVVTLRDLFHALIARLHAIESQAAELLPKVAALVVTPALGAAITARAEACRARAGSVRVLAPTVRSTFDRTRRAADDPLIDAYQHYVSDSPSAVIDLAALAAVCRTTACQAAAYRSACLIASRLHFDAAVEILRQGLDDAISTDQELQRIMTAEVLPRADGETARHEQNRARGAIGRNRSSERVRDRPVAFRF